MIDYPEDIARRFLNKVLPPEGPGWYCILHIHGKKKQHYFVKTIEELWRKSFDLDNIGGDVYFAVATFNNEHSRDAGGTHKLKTLFVDLDISDTDDRAYNNSLAATAELSRFCEAHNWPVPMLVNSGHGFHLYWHLEEALLADQWHAHALAFRDFLKSCGLKIKDPGLSADRSRVLRIPGTTNRKSAPSPVSIDKPFLELPALSLERLQALLPAVSVPELALGF